ncbi:hypothetical protein pipiens_019236 [Culex pipiens pipiens]|uniref:C2H2-type domain-containing protein n=1 Tax=Culex pipiens pipiens TaxID=38569 RepID=A0ABD1DVI1_CULPP
MWFEGSNSPGIRSTLTDWARLCTNESTDLTALSRSVESLAGRLWSELFGLDDALIELPAMMTRTTLDASQSRDWPNPSKLLLVSYKKFLTQRSLANHLKTIEKRFRCDQCGKSFAQQGELKLHQRFHNGERPYQCTVCGKSYKSASLRTAHMDSHIEGKTFQCQICDKQLQTRTCYRNHLKRHSEEKKHECDVCSKKFYTKYHAKIHKEKVHKPNKVQGKAEGKLNK